MSRVALAVVFFLLSIFPLSAQSQTAEKDGVGFYRYPALPGNTLVFAAEGDL